MALYKTLLDQEPEWTHRTCGQHVKVAQHLKAIQSAPVKTPGDVAAAASRYEEFVEWVKNRALQVSNGTLTRVGVSICSPVKDVYTSFKRDTDTVVLVFIMAREHVDCKQMTFVKTADTEAPIVFSVFDSTYKLDWTDQSPVVPERKSSRSRNKSSGSRGSKSSSSRRKGSASGASGTKS